jgi:hypothetical protein
MLGRCGSSNRSRSRRRIYYILSLRARCRKGRSRYRCDSLSDCTVAVYLSTAEFIIIAVYLLTLEFNDSLVSK